MIFRSMIVVLIAVSVSLGADEPLDVWPGLAPGETTRSMGDTLPFRAQDKPPITRVTDVTRPTMTVHVPTKPNGTAAIILPGGGFGKVVPDLEGTEAADWLNRHGVTCFVVSYRTTSDRSVPGWQKPLQDAQRAVSLIRSQATRWSLDPQRIGLVAFSAGGQVAARFLSAPNSRSYDSLDAVDETSCRPDFAVLIYPWNIYEPQEHRLVDGVSINDECPPVFLVHTHDDRSSSAGAALYYAELRRRNIPAALHIYGNGGHGYGLRPVSGSQISTWPKHAAHWLMTRKLATAARSDD